MRERARPGQMGMRGVLVCVSTEQCKHRYKFNIFFLLVFRIWFVEFGRCRLDGLDCAMDLEEQEQWPLGWTTEI